MNLYLKTKDYAVTEEEFSLHYNVELDMLITRPQPKELDIYYRSENYISHTDASRTFTEKLYQQVKKIALLLKLRLINKYAKEDKTLLDIGAGTGDFLAMAKQKNWSVFGVEPNWHARGKASEKGINLQSSLDTLVNRKYQVITLWHVLEHLEDLEDQILKMQAMLAVNGTLIIAVPNYKSYDAKYYKGHWAAYDVPRHLWHFSREAIQRLFGKYQMKVIATKPLIFDSFYVSLLSEKYKGSKLGFVKGIFRGLLSNCSALFTKEYSSLIYVIKKA